MFDRDALLAATREGRVAVDKHGSALVGPMAYLPGPAVLIVEPLTDALKLVEDDGLVVDSIDRAVVSRVVAIVLGETVLQTLPDGPIPLAELIDAVGEAGFEWAISPTSAL
jgi:hypothetical protein